MEGAGSRMVDDDRATGANLRDMLVEEGFAGSVAHSASSALALCADRTFDLCVIDLLLPDMPGTELIRKLEDATSTTEYIIITGHASLESAITAARSPAVVGYETKPLNIDHLLSLLKQVTARSQAEHALSASEWRLRTCAENLLAVLALFSAVRAAAGRIFAVRYADIW